MTDKRIRVTPDELAIIEGLRHEKAIWNEALAAALRVLDNEFNEDTRGTDYRIAVEKIMGLRK